MTTPIDGLDDACPVCDRPYGEHTMREYSACVGTPTTDLPYERVSADIADAAAAAIHERFGIPGDVQVADNVVVRALTLEGDAPGLTVKFPALLHEFSIGVPGQPPATVAQVLFVGDETVVRKYGVLVRDSANGAVNAARNGGRG